MPMANITLMKKLGSWWTAEEFFAAAQTLAVHWHVPLHLHQWKQANQNINIIACVLRFSCGILQL